MIPSNQRRRSRGGQIPTRRTANRLALAAALAAVVAGVATRAPASPRLASRSDAPAGPVEAVLSGAARPSHHGLFRAAVVHAAEAWDSGEAQTWTIQVRRADGSPVTGARLQVDAWMPDTGERAPRRPRVGAGDADGRYRIQGLRFGTPGWWNVPVQIRAAEGTDSLAFNLVVRAPSPAAATGRPAGGGW